MAHVVAMYKTPKDAAAFDKHDHLSHNAYFLAYNAVPATVTRQSMGIYNMGRECGL